ncbi:hypothetical protein TI04_03125 [Achromatium sp. WMS2]|nr:hypothetical protein TI04_03125 [Achromatium sp. WMS2]
MSIRLTDEHLAQIITCIILIGLVIIGRLLPHPPNFTPMVAVGLFSGFYFSQDYRLSILTPLVAIFLSDVILGFYDLRIMAFVYLGVLASTVLGQNLRVVSPMVGVYALLSTILFFVISNFAVWLFSGMYPQTIAGLVLCYTAAIPFLKYAVLGDWLWTAFLFFGYSLILEVCWWKRWGIPTTYS